MWQSDRVARNCVWLALLMLLASGCQVFGPSFDRTFVDKLDSLKAYHVKFIEDFTAGPGKQWDQAKVDSACAQGDRRFEEAAAYAEGKGGNRKPAVDLLHDVFKKNCEFLGKGALWSAAASAELKEEVEGNYADARAGECSRAYGSPATC